ARIAQGPLMLPLKPETILQQIAVDDIGAFAAMAFEHPGKWNGTATDLAGDELFVDQIAQTLQTSYTQIPWEDFEKQSGPEMTAMFKWFENVGYHADITDLRQKHHGLMTFERWKNTFWPSPA
ncbi:MAG: NmrA family NAD(P)-binding protein, partial [Bryobacteraceae bacterium]